MTPNELRQTVMGPDARFDAIDRTLGEILRRLPAAEQARRTTLGRPR
jgi:hypothetical protein